MSSEIEKPTICPQCGQQRIQRMIYGLLTPQAMAEIAERDDEYSAGCMVREYLWRCKNCTWEWGPSGQGRYGSKPVSVSWLQKIQRTVAEYQNESTIDRFIRAVVGIELVLIAFLKISGAWQIAGYVLGAILLVTAIDGFCALYIPFGINTKKK